MRVFHWSLSNSKSSQVSRTLLTILAVLNNIVVWMVSSRPVISKSSSPCTNPLVTVLRAQNSIDIVVTFMFHSFFNYLARSRYLSLFSHSFNLLCGPQSCNFSLFCWLLFTPLEFFTSTLDGGLSFEWQQVSSSLQDTPRYSGRSQQCCSLDGLHSSSNFQVL